MYNSAYSPSHITGILEIFNNQIDVLHSGSRGAGFCLQSGVITKVRARKATHSSFNIKINGRLKNNSLVSENVIKRMFSILNNKYHIEVEHNFFIPIGAGFGSSGASALSLALALNNELDLGLSRIQAAQIAHIADFECKTGLGTVIAETYGGFELRLKAGAPGIGKVQKISIPKNIVVVALHLSGIRTNNVLINEKFCKKVNQVGKSLVEIFSKNKSIINFMNLSKKFVESLGLISKREKKIIYDLDRCGFQSSIALFGETVYSLVKINESNEVIDILNKHAPSMGTIVLSRIDDNGAKNL
jgi:pantoate kinase